MITDELRYTLLTDGPSDDALIPLLNWLLREQGVVRAVIPMWADIRRVLDPPRKLPERIRWALEWYPCDILFIHRDAEKQDPSQRLAEIDHTLESLKASRNLPPVETVPIIPVRMTEAWLLFDEQVIRTSAGNPNGKVKLELPKKETLEQVPDPKEVLYSLLKIASELHGSRLKKFSTRGSARRVSELLDDFTPLRSLNAFKALEHEIGNMIRKNKWDKI